MSRVRQSLDSYFRVDAVTAPPPAFPLVVRPEPGSAPERRGAGRLLLAASRRRRGLLRRPAGVAWSWLLGGRHGLHRLHREAARGGPAGDPQVDVVGARGVAVGQHAGRPRSTWRPPRWRRRRSARGRPSTLDHPALGRPPGSPTPAAGVSAAGAPPATRTASSVVLGVSRLSGTLPAPTLIVGSDSLDGQGGEHRAVAGHRDPLRARPPASPRGAARSRAMRMPLGKSVSIRTEWMIGEPAAATRVDGGPVHVQRGASRAPPRSSAARGLRRVLARQAR